MDKKLCRWCNIEKPIDDFYTHPQMADGRLNKCIACCKDYAHRRYDEALPRIHAYEHSEGRRQQRAKRVNKHLRKYRRANPEKNRARNVVAYYFRTGKIKKSPCRNCGDPKVEAHHADYSKPLEVIWLCHFHHRLEEGRLRRP